MTSWWAPERLLSLSRWLFGLFFLLALGTALPLAPDIDVTPIAWESLGFLLAGALLAWGVSLWQWRTFLQVHWGRLAPPLAGLTLWFLINGLSVSLRRLAIQGVVWAFVWAAMLLYLNTRPRLRGVVALIIGIQSLVAIGQFVLQRDLGLQFLGERPLVPTVEGISVLLDSEQRVLRSYGLTGHPNYLGATLAIFTLFLLDQVEDAASIERWEIASAIVVGGVGLVLSFSRAAWLGFGAAVAAWIGLQLHAHRNIRTAWPQVRRLWMLLPAVLILIPARNLVVSRLFTLDNALETQSISERLASATVALELFLANSGWGIGVGNYVSAAATLAGTATFPMVHNVPLLVAAETGLPGVLAWGWLAASGFVQHKRVWPLWIAMLVIGLFDLTLWPPRNLDSALIVGFILAIAGDRETIGVEDVHSRRRQRA